MPSIIRTTSLVLISTTLVVANLLTPRYPAPVDLSSKDSLVTTTWHNLSAAFDGHLNRSSPLRLLTGVENITFSLGLFSIHDPNAKAHQYHYASNETRNAKAGVNNVDEDSIYLIASVSKVFTTYAGMVSLTDEQWNRPLSNIFPNLTEVQAKYTDPEWMMLISQWDKITPLGLASHLSGVIGNSPPYIASDAYATYQIAEAIDPMTAINPTLYGLPEYDGGYPFFNPSCLLPDINCTGDKYIFEARERAPTFLPWTSPSYSNHGFTLLGLSIAALTGKSLDDVFRNGIFEPLRMASSYYTLPESMNNRSVLPGGTFFYDAGISKASGGICSTLSDLNEISIGILNSTLIPAERTRKWMKPMAHTASPNFSIGAPWEIFRYTHPTGPSTGIVTDLYCKLGDSGVNGAAMCMIPAYGAGFNLVVMSSMPTRSHAQSLLFDAAVKQLVPALEAQATAEAKVNMAGTFISTNPNLNTTLTLAQNPSVPGLTVTRWISNGTDVLANQLRIFGNGGGLRFLPTIAERGTRKYASRILKVNNATTAALAERAGPLNSLIESNYDWALGGQRTYAGVPINLALFDISPAGEATAVELPGFRVKLQKI